MHPCHVLSNKNVLTGCPRAAVSSCSLRTCLPLLLAVGYFGPLPSTLLCVHTLACPPWPFTDLPTESHPSVYNLAATTRIIQVKQSINNLKTAKPLKLKLRCHFSKARALVSPPWPTFIKLPWRHVNKGQNSNVCFSVCWCVCLGPIVGKILKNEVLDFSAQTRQIKKCNTTLHKES